jgi:teichuronic acid biosynthesis glycosyltransferase TuaC
VDTSTPFPILGNPQREERKSLRVLTLTPFYPSADDDSAGCFIAEPLRALSNLGIANTVFAVQPFYRGKTQASQDSLPTEWMRYLSLPGGIGLPTAGASVFARVVGRVRRLQQSSGIDLIHAHGPLPCGHAAMLLNTELGLPYVVSVHGRDAFSTEQVKGRAGEWCRRISRRVYRSSQRVICISECVRNEVLQGVDGVRTSVVYNGVDSEMFSPGADPASAQVLLSVGNLTPIKGHATLIRACAALSSEFPSLTLEIIGEGPEMSRLTALADELDVDDRVRFAGRQSRRQVADAMRRCTIFGLPSRYEGLGCVYLEAMSVGKPAIGCRGQGIAEIIQHGTNGYLVGPDNDRELSLAIAMLLRDERRRDNIGIAARDTIVERLTLQDQAGWLARIYRESVR